MPPAASSSGPTWVDRCSPIAVLRACAVLVLAAAQAGWASPSDTLRTGVPCEDNPSIDRHRVLVTVMGLMGTPHPSAAVEKGQLTLDCSSFAARVYREALGVMLPRTAADQFGAGRPVPRDSLLFGDLVFFDLPDATANRDEPSHVGVYVGDGLFAHASIALGVTVSLLSSASYEPHFLGARRFLP